MDAYAKKLRALKEIDDSEKEVVGKPLNSFSNEKISKKPKSFQLEK